MPDHSAAKLGIVVDMRLNYVLEYTLYKDIRLGGPNAKPSYSYINWIAMLFSAGLGIGLLFYGVAEPIMHLNSYPGMIEGNTSYNAGKAIGLANLHWGLHGWAIYSLLGLCFWMFLAGAKDVKHEIV